jgi:hypothetical protein
MHTMKKMSVLLIGSSLLLLSSFLFYHENSQAGIMSLPEYRIDASHLRYLDYVAVDQDHLQLDHEYAQYQIRFHENTSVTFSMNVTHVMLDFDPVCYRMYLTNDSGFVTNDSHIIDTQVMAGVFFDASVHGHRIAIGGRRLLKKIPIGASQTRNETVNATKGDTWYLTVIVLRKKLEVVNFTAHSVVPCMEVVPVLRGSNLGLYSAWDGDFDGRYIGIKLLPLTPFGFSYANINKTITTHNGTVYEFISAFHQRGGITIGEPNGMILTQSEKHGCLLMGCTTTSGVWQFSAWGIGLPYKHLVLLFYADIDIHLKEQEASRHDFRPDFFYSNHNI